MQRIYERNLVTIEDSRRVHEKLLDEINASLKREHTHVDRAERWYQFKSVWDYHFSHR